jgi:hypothetical protein
MKDAMNVNGMSFNLIEHNVTVDENGSISFLRDMFVASDSAEPWIQSEKFQTMLDARGHLLCGKHVVRGNIVKDFSEILFRPRHEADSIFLLAHGGASEHLS